MPAGRGPVASGSVLRQARGESITGEEGVARLSRTAPGLIHAHLQEALAALESALGPSAALEELKDKVRILETAYG